MSQLTGVSGSVSTCPAPPPSSPSLPSPPPPTPPPPLWCDDTCAHASNGACQDGGEGSLTALYGTPAQCAFATDCADCGPRFMFPPSPPPPSPPPAMPPPSPPPM